MNKNQILQRPNGKYWTSEDIQALEEAKNYDDLLIIALRVLDRMPQPIVQICGPLTTGGLGSMEANMAEFEKAIFFFSQQGECVFDQIPFEEPMQRFKKDVIDGYDERILFDFYQPIFKSGKIKTMKFLPGWEKSTGANWENTQAKQWNIQTVYLPIEWHLSKYEKRGVSADKEDVEDAIKNLSKGLFPGSFCKILPDIAGDPEYCCVLHADGAGTKSSLAYIVWKETGNLAVWKDVAQDSVVMNLDDVLAIGATEGPMYLSGNIGRNKGLIPGEVITEIINGTEEFLQEMRDRDINIQSAGGETADVGDLVRTIIIDNTLMVRIKKKDIINASNIKPGNIIVGLSSSGKAIYEKKYNGGMGSNGLTSARHDVLCSDYITKYPESFDPKLLESEEPLVYCGKYHIKDTAPEFFENDVTYENTIIGDLIRSTTRTYAPVIKKVLEDVERKKILGMIHCSGGAQTKVLKYVNNVHIIKDNMFPTPPLFNIIQSQSKTPWEEMYKVFNMGHRYELYVENEETANQIIKISESFDVEARIIGRVEACETKKLTIKSKYGELIY
ncbi:MAG: AIR synthase related protein [bacterium]